MIPEGRFILRLFGNDTNGVVIEYYYIQLNKDTIPPNIYYWHVGNRLSWNGPPEIVCDVNDASHCSKWYTINKLPEKHFFRDPDRIDDALWESFPPGDVNITIMVEDEAGNMASRKAVVEKYREEDGTKDRGIIDGYEITLFLLGVVSISILLIKYYQKQPTKIL